MILYNVNLYIYLRNIVEWFFSKIKVLNTVFSFFIFHIFILFHIIVHVNKSLETTYFSFWDFILIKHLINLYVFHGILNLDMPKIFLHTSNIFMLFIHISCSSYSEAMWLDLFNSVRMTMFLKNLLRVLHKLFVFHSFIPGLNITVVIGS